MRMSKLVTKTRKDASQSDPSRNAQLLTRAGYVSRLMAGAYSFLPLGKRVLENIERIVREEMDAIGGQEILLPALQPKEKLGADRPLGQHGCALQAEGRGRFGFGAGPNP